MIHAIPSVCMVAMHGRYAWSLFPVLVINSFTCETDEIDICAFPYYKYSSAFARFENMDSSWKSFVRSIPGKPSTHFWKITKSQKGVTDELSINISPDTLFSLV